MNGTKLIIECGVASTRAALIKDDIVWRFWLGPARGDEGLDTEPRAGRKFIGRVRSVNASLNAAFVDIGDAVDAYLPLKKAFAGAAIDGAMIDVTVKSPPRQSKGAVLRFGEKAKAGAILGRTPPFEDAALEAVRFIGGGAEEIIIDDGRARAFLEALALEAPTRHEQHSVALFEKYGAEAEIAAAFDGVVPLQGGGRLIIEEAQALTAIDVDTVGLAASSPARLREKICVAAAYEAVRQISLRNIGGHIVIDFPSIDDKASRQRFSDHLKKAMKLLEGAGATSFSKSGLFSFTMPHRALSLRARCTEHVRGDLIAGRQFTIDWISKSAMRALEHRLRAAPSGRFKLFAGADIHQYFQMHGIWLERLQERYGARADIIASNEIGDRNFDLAE